MTSIPASLSTLFPFLFFRRDQQVAVGHLFLPSLSSACRTSFFFLNVKRSMFPSFSPRNIYVAGERLSPVRGRRLFLEAIAGTTDRNEAPSSLVPSGSVGAG